MQPGASWALSLCEAGVFAAGKDHLRAAFEAGLPVGRPLLSAAGPTSSLREAGVFAVRPDACGVARLREDAPSRPPRHRKLARIENPGVSVVVPVYNEERALPALLPQLRMLAGACELVVVDGGSADATREVLAREAPGVRVISSAKGRARQMNAGARATSGDVLFFLHADSALPPDPVGQLLRVMRTHDAGCFGIRFDRRHAVLGLCSWMSNARVWARGIAYGDQGIFMRRELFEEVGGFPELPLMEDFELSLELRRRGVRFGMTRGRITTSSRRFGAGAAQMLKTWCAMVRLRRAYLDGTDIHEVAARYRDIR